MGTRIVSLIGSALLLAGAAGCKNAASAEQCTQAMNNILEIEFATAGAKADSPELKAEIAKQKKTAADAKITEYMDACQNKTPRHLVECTIEAKTAAQLTACDETK